MVIKYRKLKNLIYLHIKKDNEEILIINEKYKNKKLVHLAEQTSNCTQNS